MKTATRPASARPAPRDASPLKQAFPRWIPAVLLAGGAACFLTLAARRSAHRRPARATALAQHIQSPGSSAPGGGSAPGALAADAPAQAGAEKIYTARKLSWRAVKKLQHDPGAFLQGLLWSDGGFYEGTGLEGRSSLRRLGADGRVLKKIALPPEVFGEGLVAWKDSLIQISWKNGLAWKWDRATFAPRGQWRYEGEGWGVTNDGRELIMSDGSDTLFFRDPTTFAIKHAVHVTFNGRPLRDLNELEFINGRVWANVWQTDSIVLIDPKTGIVTGFLDLKGILPQAERTGREDVLNGIAYDASTRRIWVSGKQWPRIFQIEVEGEPPSTPVG